MLPDVWCGGCFLSRRPRRCGCSRHSSVGSRDLDNVLITALASVAPGFALGWVIVGMVTAGAMYFVARLLRPIWRRSPTACLVLGIAFFLGVSTELHDHTSLMQFLTWGALLTTVISGILCGCLWVWIERHRGRCLHCGMLIYAMTGKEWRVEVKASCPNCGKPW